MRGHSSYPCGEDDPECDGCNNFDCPRQLVFTPGLKLCRISNGCYEGSCDNCETYNMGELVGVEIGENDGSEHGYDELVAAHNCWFLAKCGMATGRHWAEGQVCTFCKVEQGDAEFAFPCDKLTLDQAKSCENFRQEAPNDGAGA